MAHAEKTVVIHRPVESVYDFILNGGNKKLWRSSVMDIKPLTDAPYGVGSRFEQGLKGPTGRIAGDYEITEVKPNELIRFQVIAGPARPTGTYRFQPRDDGTELTFVLDYPADQMPRQMDAAATRQMLQAAQAEPSSTEKMSQPEKRVVDLVSQGRSEQEISRSLSLGQGTIRNFLFSARTKLMEPMIQRSMEQEVAMLENLKAYLEKHV